MVDCDWFKQLLLYINNRLPGLICNEMRMVNILNCKTALLLDKFSSKKSMKPFHSSVCCLFIILESLVSSENTIPTRNKSPTGSQNFIGENDLKKCGKNWLRQLFPVLFIHFHFLQSQSQQWATKKTCSKVNFCTSIFISLG